MWSEVDVSSEPTLEQYAFDTNIRTTTIIQMTFCWDPTVVWLRCSFPLNMFNCTFFCVYEYMDWFRYVFVAVCFFDLLWKPTNHPTVEVNSVFNYMRISHIIWLLVNFETLHSTRGVTTFVGVKIRFVRFETKHNRISNFNFHKIVLFATNIPRGWKKERLVKG